MTLAPRPHAYVGTSGWSYAGWRHGFYAGVPQKRWLAHCATRFTAIEVNATFYRILAPDVVERWRMDTPASFAFAAKGHRMVTHRRRLLDVDEPLARTRDGLAPLGNRLKAVLWQLPPTLSRDDGLLREFADRLDAWPGPRHVIEFRDPSWFADETLSLLGTRNLGTCISDAAKWPSWDAVSAHLGNQLDGIVRGRAPGAVVEVHMNLATVGQPVDDPCRPGPDPAFAVGGFVGPFMAVQPDIGDVRAAGGNA